MLEIRFATIGTSKITRNFLSAASNVPEFKLEAVYSRNIKNAEEFGNSYGVTKFYDNLTSLAEDSTIDAVYIASPNAFHCSQASIYFVKRLLHRIRRRQKKCSEPLQKIM